jgi:hypothetical protein
MSTWATVAPFLLGMSKTLWVVRQSNFRASHSMTARRCYHFCLKICMRTATKSQKSPTSNKRTRMAAQITLWQRSFGTGFYSEKSQSSSIFFTANSNQELNAVFANTSPSLLTLTTFSPFPCQNSRANASSRHT